MHSWLAVVTLRVIPAVLPQGHTHAGLNAALNLTMESPAVQILAITPIKQRLNLNSEPIIELRNLIQTHVKNKET